MSDIIKVSFPGLCIVLGMGIGYLLTVLSDRDAARRGD